MSYSCMPNIGDIISMHNKALLQSNKKTKDKDTQCNCRDRSTFPLEGRCKEGLIVNKATLTHKINRWYTIGAVKRNSKLDTIITNKASSSKTKNTPQNSRKQFGMLKMQEKPH